MKTFKLEPSGWRWVLFVGVLMPVVSVALGAFMFAPLLLLDGELTKALLAVLTPLVLLALGTALEPKPRLVVGTDGIAIRERHRTRFHPWREVLAIENGRSKRRVTLRLRNGTTQPLHTKAPKAVGRALTQGLERHRAASRSAPLRALEPTEGLDDEWVERVKTVTRQRNYRVDVSAETLLAVVEDSEQSAAQRIGAALALSDGPEEVRRRVRVAIDETADPELARALDEAASGDVSSRSLRRAVRR